MSADPARALGIAAEFDAKAPTYETYRLAPWYKAHGEAILAALDDPGDGAVLDIGCGTGWLLRRIARSFPAARGIGLDLSGVMVETARHKAAAAGLDRLDFVKADWESPDAERLPGLSGKRINAIVCANAFHYFGDTEEAVAKMFRALAPGGELVLLERAKERSLLTLIWDVLHRFLIRDQVRFYSSSELTELICGAGFSNVEVKTKIKRWLWHNKFFTSVVLISAKKR